MPIPIPEATRPGLDQYTIELCEKTAEPKNAYVVFEMKKYVAKEIEGKWTRTWRTGLAWLNLQDQPNQAWAVTEYILGRGMKIIGYGNIPSINSSSPRLRAIYKAHSEGGAGDNAYDKIRAHCDTFIDQRSETNKEILGYKAELEKLRKQVSEISNTKTGSLKDANKDKQEIGSAPRAEK